MTSNSPSIPLIRREVHYHDRIVKCFAERPQSVLQMFHETCRAHAGREALIDGPRRLTYGALEDAASRIAAGLTVHGIGPGDRVAILLANRIEFATAFFAILYVGAIAVPMNIREQQPEILDVLTRCGAKMLIHEAELTERLPPIDVLPDLLHRFTIDGVGEGSMPFEALQASTAATVYNATEDDTAVLLYTSGTTGKPKGAMLSNLALVTSTIHYDVTWRFSWEDRAVMAVPASHVTGLVAILLTMMRVGGATILMRSFKAQEFLALAAAERMTYTLIVPAMYNLCLLRDGLSGHDLSAWRVGAYGGAPMPPATIETLAGHLPHLELVNAYGSTETCSPTSLTPMGEGRARADTVGRPLPCADILIMDDAGQAVPPGASGEIWVGGAHVSPGYWADEAATQASFVGGMWCSGDIGSLSEDGYLRILDRKKDMVNRAGFKVYPAEVEAVLAQHPAIIETAIIGVPDAVLGEKTHAFVVTANGSLTGDAVRTFCRSRLSDYKIPDFVTLIDMPLPRNANGKIVKRALMPRSASDA